MSKHLSISSINQWHNKEFSQMERIIFKDGSYCDVYKKFKPTSIQKLILDYQDIMKQLQSKEVNIDVAKSIIFVFYMLLLKHFTSIGNKIPMKIEQMIQLCERLIDLGILEEILNSFPQEEIDKVNKMIHQVNENTKIFENQIGELFSQVALSEQKEDESSA